MTSNERHSAPVGPPWSVDALADLHAGAVEDNVAEQMWPRVKADPSARAVLKALDATRADLADLPPVPMPADVAARIDAALADEARKTAQAPTPPRGTPASTSGNVIDLAQARRRRNRRLGGWGAGLVAAAAAVIGVVFAVSPNHSTPGNGVAAPAQPAQPGAGNGNGGAVGQPMALTSGHGMSQQQLTSALSEHDFGAFGDERKLAGCLTANKVPVKAGTDVKQRVAGIGAVTLDGKPGTMMLISDGPAKWRLLVVGADCAAGNRSTMENSTIG